MIRVLLVMLARRLLALACLAVSLVLAAPPALACSVCQAGDPLVAAGDAAADERQLRLSLDTEWLVAKAAVEDMPGVEERVEQRTLRLGVVATPVARLNVVLLAPFTRKSVEVRGAGAEHGDVAFTGLGDVELGARYFLLEATNFDVMRHHSFAVSAGSSLPTGPNDRTHDGVRDEHAQLGTGAFGPYAGVLYRLEQSRWHGFASLTGRYRTENDFRFRYGASLAWTAQGQVELHPRLVAGLALDGREAWPDEEDGLAVPNTGGLVLALAPSLYLDLGRGVWLSVRAQVPVATRLRGDQEVGPVVTAGIQLRLL